VADFNTHFFVATAVGAIYATAATKGLVLPTEAALLLASMTAIGGILPDIDLKDSKPSKALFLVLGALLAILWMAEQIERFSVVELLAVGALLFVGIRYLLWWLFHQFTVHRGSLHSLTASAMFGSCAAVLCYHFWAFTATESWLAGVAVTLGCVTHLLLDELYSVDFTGARIKRSFGSALKLFDGARWPGSLAVLAVTAAAFWFAPPIGPLLEALKSVDPNWQDWILSAGSTSAAPSKP